MNTKNDGMLSINYVAILVAAIVNIALGYVWYGPLFGRHWMKLTGRTKESMTKEKVMRQLKIGPMFVGALVMAYVLAVFIALTNSTTALMGAMIGFWAWLGFVTTTTLEDLLHEKKNKQVAFIYLGYDLAVLVANGIILAVWK